MTLTLLALLTGDQALRLGLDTSWLGPGGFCVFLLGMGLHMDGIKILLFGNVLLASFLFIRTGLRGGRWGKLWCTGNRWLRCWFQALTSSILNGINLNGLVSHISGFYSNNSGVLKWFGRFMLVLTILGFWTWIQVFIECIDSIEFVTFSNIGIHHWLSWASITNTVVGRTFVHSCALSCGEAISLLVVCDTIKAHCYLELRLSCSGGAMSEHLRPSSSICLQARPAWRQLLF